MTYMFGFSQVSLATQDHVNDKSVAVIVRGGGFNDDSVELTT